MTDPTMPRRPLPPVAAPTGILREIRAEARRRRVRRMQIAGAAGTSTLLLVTAVALVGAGPSTAGLEPVTPAVVEPTDRSVVPPPSAPTAAPSPPAVGPVAAVRPGGAPAAPRAQEAPATARPAAPTTGVPRARSADRAPHRAPVTRSEREAGVQGPCTSGTELPAWCLQATVDDGAGGERSTLLLSACPADRTRAVELDFARDVETRFVVSQGSREVWASDDGRYDADPHSVQVPAGRCVVWTVEWDQTSATGHLVEPGEYSLTATSYAEQVASAPSSTTSFTVGGSTD